MAHLHTHDPAPGDIARAVIAEAMRSLAGTTCSTVPACLGAAFATSDQDRPAVLGAPVLVVLLAEAVIRQEQRITALETHVAQLSRRASELDSRTLGDVTCGPRPAPRPSRWPGGRPARAPAGASEPAAPVVPPHPTGGIGE